MLIQFAALDTWCFGGAQTSNGREELLLPSAQTLAGATRQLLGDFLKINWYSQWWQDTQPVWSTLTARQLIGEPDDCSALVLKGPYLFVDGEQYLPAPAHLLSAASENHGIGYCLTLPLKPLLTDQGHVLLMQRPKDVPPDSRSAGGQWLIAAEHHKVLNGPAPQALHLVDQQQWFCAENRLGIAIDQHTRIAVDTALYQNTHQRLNHNLTVRVELLSLPADLAEAFAEHLQKQPIIRFGAAGRMAEVSVVTTAPTVPPVNNDTKVQHVGLTTITDLLLDAPLPDGQWVLPGFERTAQNGIQQMLGQISGQMLNIVSSVNDKTSRVGGWDLNKRQSRPIRSFLPAGSVFIAALPQPQSFAGLSKTLNGQQLGLDTHLGYGEVRCCQVVTEK
jgi:CRISPR-associated protein Cmr3